MDADISEVEKNPNLVVLGCATSEYYRNSNIAMLSYLVTRTGYRKLGLAQKMMKALAVANDKVWLTILLFSASSL